MKAVSVSKIKYLKIWDILRQETDEQHPSLQLTLLRNLKRVALIVTAGLFIEILKNSMKMATR